MRPDRNLRNFRHPAASAAAIAAAAFTSLGWSGAAFAQASVDAQAYASAPADHLLVTKGGVDMRSGKYQFSQTDVSIGEEGSALALTRTPRQGPYSHVLAFANFSHNWDLFIAEKRVNIDKGEYEYSNGSDYRMTVYDGGGAEAFDGRVGQTVFFGTSKGATSWLTYAGDRSTGTAVYTLRKTDGTLVTFRPINSGDCATYQRCAYVSKIAEPDGTVLKFEYDQPGGVNTSRLRSVSSNRGYALLLEYSGANVTKACVLNLSGAPKPSGNICPSGAKAATYGYGYASETVLTSVTDPANATWSYVYGVSGPAKTMGFVKPGASAPFLTNTYGASVGSDDVHDIIHSQQFADGQVYNYDYTDIYGQTNGTINQIAGGVVTDGQGHSVSVQYGTPLLPRSLTPGFNSGQEEFPDPGQFPGDPEGGTGYSRIYQLTSGPVSVTDELGRTTTYEYCDPVVEANLPATDYERCVVLPLRYYTDPEGMRTDVTRAENGLIGSAVRHPKPGSTLGNATMVLSYAPCAWYPNSCTKPESALDPNGNVTHFGYTSFGEPEWEISPPPTSGAARALKLYTYAQKYAYVSNGSALVPSDTPVWVRASETVCQTVAGTGTGRPSSTPACDFGAQVTTTQYEYGPDGTANNLRVRGVLVSSGGTGLRTCYGYDLYGNKIWTTTPRAGLAACN